jgi:Rieske Fe-S protein
MIQDINRRVVLQTLGLGGATFLVGCNITTPDVTDPGVAALSSQDQTTTCPGNITLTVKVKKGESAAEQQKHAVLKVEFYRGTALLGTITAAPYTLKIDITPENLVKYEDDGKPEDEDKCGYYAKIYYQNGKVQKTDKIRVKVDKTCTPGTTDTTPPMVSLASSSNTVNTDGKVTLTASATDETGGSGIAKIDFLEGTTVLGSTTAAPFAFDIAFTQTNNGTHNYIAKAYDKAGNSASSTPSVSVVVNIPGTPPTDTTAPVVTLSSSSLNVTAAGSVTLTAGATDNAGGSGIASLELFDGATSLGVKTAAPFTWARMLTSSDNGTKVYTAKATDKAGNVGTSPTVSVMVNIAATPPTISLAASSTNVTAAGSSTLTATVTAGTGTITKVEFFEGTTLLGTKTAAPYTYAPAYTSANNGTHDYTAKVTASDGSTATSAIASVLVKIPVVTNPGTLIALFTALPAAGSYVNFNHPTSGIKCILYRAATAQTGGVSNAGAFYVAYSRKCTHAGTIITQNPNTANPHVLTCQDHGATYNMDSNCTPINGIAPMALPTIVIAAGTDGIYI